jgi:endonuclease/exonuclease/phosphatase family metal-dependent hydrolase
MKRNTTKKTIAALRLVFFVLIISSSAAFPALANDEATVTIMTQNMDAGTDLGFILALEGTPESVDLTLAEIQASDIPGRAALLATQIAAEQPDIVALEEVTTWRMGTTPETATDVLYDQLALLLSALADEGVPYDIVAVNTLTDLALPGSTDYALRYTDRDALLVRSDLRPPAFHLSDVHSRIYDAALSFGELPIYQGWISADVHIGNRHFRLVETHLESPIPGVEAATEVQVAQAEQLVHTLRNLRIPVVVCGDFNSDANFGSGPDATPSVSLIEAAGYADTWMIANPNDPGDTWPLFLEDQYPPPFFVPYTPFERIDLFFSRGIDIVGVREILAPASAGNMPPYGSDHAGVIATFQP